MAVWIVKKSDSNSLYHYGIKKRSGRYPWGSGDRPYQRLEGTGRFKRRPEKKDADDFSESNTFNKHDTKRMVKTINHDSKAARKQIIEVANKNERYREAMAALEPARKLYKKYLDRKEEYQEDAVDCLVKNGQIQEKDRAAILDAYKHDDLDQGSDSSFNYFLIDNGVSLKDLAPIVDKIDNLDHAKNEVVEKILGNRGRDYAITVRPTDSAYIEKQSLAEFIEWTLDLDSERYDGLYNIEEAIGSITPSVKSDIENYYRNKKRS